jgi:hypothetical protein
MTKPLRLALLCLLSTFWCGILQAAGDDQKKADTAATDTSSFIAIDKGLDTINVSSYPKDMQTSYKLVKTKCSQCHKLARVINSDYALPDEWSRYVKRMRRKPSSNISSDEAKAIYEFLTFDSQKRKADLIKKKLAESQKATDKK